MLNDTICDQVCVNTDGSFHCDCEDGFQLVEGTNQCEGIIILHDKSSYYCFLLSSIDINECEGVNDCQQRCENSVGSFTCSCENGFTLSSDGRNCTGIKLIRTAC